MGTSHDDGDAGADADADADAAETETATTVTGEKRVSDGEKEATSGRATKKRRLVWTPELHVHQRITQTGGYTGRLEANFEPVHTHIALLHLPCNRVKLWRIVRAHPGTVPATKTNVRIL